ncbi:15153_t:CDS:2 [Rhizophagus irregularis]|nr:15153_t:CDS:2 [Rhizophagus irregularis]
MVIVDIGVNQISAVVSDNASNIRKACEIIQDKFPTIENVRRIAHYINLIACNIVKEEFGDHLLR